MNYNVSLKVLKGKNKTDIVIRKYNKYLGSDSEIIDDYNLLQKMQSHDIDVKCAKDINSLNDFIFNNDKPIRVRTDSLVRTRKSVSDLAFINDSKFKSFITLTFKENITDVDYSYKCLHNCLDSLNRSFKRNGNTLNYLGVIEFQKRGAVHFHLLTNLECGSSLLPLQDDKKNMYSVKYWRHGFSSAFDLTKVDDNFNLVLYMTKYMVKSDYDDRLKNHRRYYHSRNLAKPRIIKTVSYNEDYKILNDLLSSSGYFTLENKYSHIAREKFEVEFDEFRYSIENSKDLSDIINILFD